MKDDAHRTTTTLIESIAGLSAGVASTLVAHPLDIVKTRLQLERGTSVRVGTSLRIAQDIYRDGGILAGCYRGLAPNLVGNSVSWALYFVCYDGIKDGIGSLRASEGGLSYYDYFIASGAAGALTALCTNPIWVIKTRMLSTSSQHPGAYPSMTDGVRRIYRAEGISGFYRGLLPSLLGVSHGALQFMAYEQLKKVRQESLVRQELSATDYLILSGVAKVFAGSITYPYQVVRARLQMYHAEQLYQGALDVVGQVWQREGLSGFYKGLAPNLLRVMPSTWVTFLVYEKMRWYLATYGLVSSRQ